MRKAAPKPRSLLLLPAILAVGATISGLLYGNDTAVTLGAGGLVPAKTNQIAMESEDLQISAHQITITYVFRNTTAQDLDMLVAFPLPDLDGGLVYHEPVKLPSPKQVNFVDFSVTSEGQPVQASMETRAFREGRDVTASLHSAGLSPNVEPEALTRAVLKLPTSERQRLEKEELIFPEDYTQGGTAKRDWWADWTLRVRFYWIQRFPANKTVKLVQTYRPVVGGSYIVAGSDGRSNLKPYCGTPQSLQRIAEAQKRSGRHRDGQVVLFERAIDYILTTANNWKGPIGHFRLLISTDSPDDILVTCTPGLNQVSSTQYELIQEQFSPKQDLKLLILQPAKQ